MPRKKPQTRCHKAPLEPSTRWPVSKGAARGSSKGSFEGQPSPRGPQQKSNRWPAALTGKGSVAELPTAARLPEDRRLGPLGKPHAARLSERAEGRARPSQGSEREFPDPPPVPRRGAAGDARLTLGALGPLSLLLLQRRAGSGGQEQEEQRAAAERSASHLRQSSGPGLAGRPALAPGGTRGAGGKAVGHALRAALDREGGSGGGEPAPPSGAGGGAAVAGRARLPRPAESGQGAEAASAPRKFVASLCPRPRVTRNPA